MLAGGSGSGSACSLPAPGGCRPKVRSAVDGQEPPFELLAALSGKRTVNLVITAQALRRPSSAVATRPVKSPQCL